MNSLKRSIWIKYATLAILAVAVGSSLAKAQDVGGKFNLPFTVRWGGVVLTPGHYSFIYGRDTAGDSRVVKVYRGTHCLGMILAWLASEGHFSDPSHLTATQAAGRYRITSLQLSDQGIRLDFPIPRREVLEASQTTRPARKVPVLRAAK